MKHSYLLAGTTAGSFFKLLAKNGFSPYPAYLGRILFLSQNGLWASAFRKREKKKFGKIIREYQMPADPVFIIGHWRTGTTFLHQLMNLDENFVTPSVLQVSVPDSFLVSEKYYAPVMSKMVNPTRPMDNVKLGVYEPQEDEYALFKLTLDSPLEKLIFPDDDGYFLNNYTDFYPEPENMEKWKNGLHTFCKKLSFTKGKRVLLKNPFHSMRIPLLREIYPEARFIHIHRHPYKVVPSTINMWNIVGRQNRLKKRGKAPEVAEVAEMMNKMLNKIRADFNDLEPGAKYEVRFEEFEKDPVAGLKKIYSHFELEYTDNLDEKVKAFLNDVKGYRKNKFNLTDAEKEIIRDTLKEQFIYYHYEE
ncbi:MAG: sulfotransferase [Chlorobi bacterium]|nr:sulfotransferase [Chlorobiota bacterium]